MTVWDGQGLPPAAAARVARAKKDGVATSFLAVGGQAGLDSIGFRPVGEVMGCIVEHIGFQGYGGCGYYMTNQLGVYGNNRLGVAYQFGSATTVTSGAGGFAGFAPYVDALYAGWDGAISRMLTEASALGADGVVGVRLQAQSLGAQNQEFMVLGTAVRSLGTQHVARPFATTLEGQDLAKLVHSGWMASALVIAISVAIRHDDYQTRMATQAFAPNSEVPGYTELANHVRADARSQFASRARSSGADGAIASSAMTLQIHELEVGENHRDHVGEATLVGTSIARFSERGVPPPLMVLSMHDPIREKR